MALPIIRTLDDIRTVMRQNRRWRRKQRVLALKSANKQLTILVRRGDITAAEAKGVRVPLIRMLNQEKRTFLERGGEAAELSPYKEPLRAVEATPAARKLATERGIALEKLRGSGQNGKIVITDVRAYQGS